MVVRGVDLSRVIYNMYKARGFTEKSEYNVNQRSAFTRLGALWGHSHKKGVLREGGDYRSYSCPPAVTHGERVLYTAPSFGFGLGCKRRSALKRGTG